MAQRTVLHGNQPRIQERPDATEIRWVEVRKEFIRAGGGHASLPCEGAVQIGGPQGPSRTLFPFRSVRNSFVSGRLTFSER